MQQRAWKVTAGNVKLAQSNNKALQVPSSGCDVALRLRPSRAKSRTHAGPILF